MWKWIALSAALAATAGVVAVVLVGDGGNGETDKVRLVRDGDTIKVAGGATVRLVQIDSPELREGECYAREARAELQRLLPVGTRVRIMADPRLDPVDRFGRRLAYAFKEDENVNTTLVARGAASVWFFHGRRGRYAGELLAAARRAKAAEVGLWGACPGTRLDALAPVQSGRD
jgi:micrococcal nuclease